MRAGQGSTPSGGVVIVAGRPMQTAAQVIQDPSVGFEGLRPRKFTRNIYLHWTGGENDAEMVVRNMTLRMCSVQFVVDATGIAYQTADAQSLCAHARGFNEESVGIEVVCKGSDLRIKNKLVERVERVEMLHGKRVRYADFTDAQKETVLRLVETLCRAYRLPMQVPLDQEGKVVARALPATYLASFQGVLGHYHTRADKLDAGVNILQLVHERGASLGIG